MGLEESMLLCFADVDKDLSVLWVFLEESEVRSVEEGRLEGVLPLEVVILTNCWIGNGMVRGERIDLVGVRRIESLDSI